MCWWTGVFCDTLMCVLHQCCACSMCVCCAACIILLTCATSYAYALCVLNVSTYSEHTLCICVSFLEINILMDNNSLLRNKKDCDQFSWKTHTKSGTYKRFEIGATKWPNPALLAQESLWNNVWHGVVRSKLTLRVRCRSVSLASHSFCLACACFTSSPPHPQAWTTEGQCYAPHRRSPTMSSLNNHTSRPEPQRDNVMGHVVTQQPHPHSTTTPQGLNHRGTMWCVMLSLNNHILTQQLHLKA